MNFSVPFNKKSLLTKKVASKLQESNSSKLDVRIHVKEILSVLTKKREKSATAIKDGW